MSIYALLSFMVTRRTREMGIRVALGARRGQVLATVAGRTTALPGGGAVAGTVLGVRMAGFQSVILIRMPEIGWATPAMVIAALVSGERDGRVASDPAGPGHSAVQRAQYRVACASTR